MLKVFDPAGFGFDQPVAEMIKVARGGLGRHDLRSLVKRAGHDFTSALAMVRPGEVPIHLIALGATEGSGANRNGDGFRESTCEARHHTFVTDAHYHRDHRNGPSDLRYGRVIKSAYHANMRRVELLVGLYETAAAARRLDGDLGLVADAELHKLASDDPVAVSMACRLPFDVCSRCGNKAPSRRDYCDDRPTKSASGRTIPACSGFGCARGLTKVAQNGDIQYVENPDCTFFDISTVGKNADRIAFNLGRFGKAAGLDVGVGGAAMAERWGLVDRGPAGDPAGPLRLLGMLVDAAARPGGPVGLGKAAACPEHALGSATRVGLALRALADEAVALPLEAWLGLAVGKEATAEVVAEIAGRLPGVHARLAADPGVAAYLADNPYAPAAGTPPASLRKWAASLVAECGTAVEAAARRAELSVLRSESVPRPSPPAGDDDGGAEKMAREYARYQVAYMGTRSAAGDRELALTARQLTRAAASPLA